MGKNLFLVLMFVQLISCAGESDSSEQISDNGITIGETTYEFSRGYVYHEDNPNVDGLTIYLTDGDFITDENNHVTGISSNVHHYLRLVLYPNTTLTSGTYHFDNDTGLITVDFRNEIQVDNGVMTNYNMVFEGHDIIGEQGSLAVGVLQNEDTLNFTFVTIFGTVNGRFRGDLQEIQ